ncbi:MAG: hypothetical protein QM791_07625 [Ferruginibacter sp.]
MQTLKATTFLVKKIVLGVIIFLVPLLIVSVGLLLLRSIHH